MTTKGDATAPRGFGNRAETGNHDTLCVYDGSGTVVAELLVNEPGQHQAVRDFALRDWRAVENSKRDYWAGRAERGGTAVLLAAAESLRRLVRAVRPDWPSAAERHADLRHHIQLKRRLDATRGAFTGQ